MNISRNLLLTALVAFSLPVLADDKATEPNQEQAVPVAPADAGNKGGDAATEAQGNEGTDGDKKEETEGGILATAKWLACLPVTLPIAALDKLSDYVGPKSIAQWLGKAPVDKDGKPAVDKDGKAIERGTVTQFFADHETGTKRVVALGGLALVSAVGYKLYKDFVAEEDDADNEYADVFGDEDFDAENN